MRKWLCIALLMANLAVQAQTEPISLNSVTVTATRTPQKINETGRNITVVDGKMFQQLPVQSLDELLKYVPGVEVQSRGPFGAQSDIVIRGGTFQQVLVLLDGVKVNDPITGHFSGYIPVAPSEIDHIEILRGPAAAIYGSEAVGGVIQVITKTFAAHKKEKSQHGQAGIALGEWGYFRGEGGLHLTGPKVNAALGILSNNTDGQLLRGNNRGFNHNHTASGSISFALPQHWTLALRMSYDGRDFAAQNFYTTFKSDTATEQVQTWWSQLQLKQQTEKVTQQFDVLYKKTSDHYVFNPQSVANDNNSTYLMAQYMVSGKVDKHITLTAGTQYSSRKIESNDRGDHSTGQGAFFASMNYTYKHLKLSPSLRLDIDGNFGSAVLPQLNVSYSAKAFNFRGSLGRAIRGGDFTERYNNYNKAFVSGGSIGNPDLTTENSWSYEAGVDWNMDDDFKIAITGFYRNQNDVIDFVTTPYANMPRKVNLSPTGVYALALNVKKVETSGIECSIAKQFQFSKQHRLYVDAGATLLQSTSSDAVASFYIISHAKTLIQSNWIYQLGSFNLSANFIYKERGALAASAINASITPNYFLCNAKLGYRLYNNHLHLFVAVNNIGNTRYSDLLGSIMPGRWGTAGVNMVF